MAAAATNGEHGSLAFEAEAVLEGHTDKATFVAFGPDGAELAVCSFDHEVGVWEVAPGRGGGWRCAATLQGHRGVVWSLAWSPGGARLASRSSDEIAR